MRIFMVALRKEMLEQWRSYRMLIVSLVFVAFGLTSPLLAKLTPEFLKLLPQGEEFAKLIPPPSMADAVGQYVKNLNQFGIILALLMAMGAVAQEKDKGTASLILVKPMPRWAFLAAKFAALCLTFLIGIVLAALGGYYYTVILFQAPDAAGWLALNGLLLLSLLVYVALTLLCSTVSRSQVVAASLAFGGLLVLAGLGALPAVGEYLPGELPTWGVRLVSGVGGASWGALAVSVALIAAAIAGAWAIFERQEL